MICFDTCIEQSVDGLNFTCCQSDNCNVPTTINCFVCFKCHEGQNFILKFIRIFTKILKWGHEYLITLCI